MIEDGERQLDSFTIAGRPVSASERRMALFSAISADYFRAMQIHCRGRELTEQDAGRGHGLW